MAVDPSKIYASLEDDKKKEFEAVVIAKLKALIGGFGELSVLAEYISVMLQSSRPQDQIQLELEAFLQEQSKPFTEWMFQQLVETQSATKESGKRKQTDAGEALLSRAVREARQGAGQEEKPRKKKAKEGKEPKEGKEKREKKVKHATAEGAVAVAALSGLAQKRKATEPGRSRSRRRRRRKEEGNEAGAGAAAKKAVLTPKPQLNPVGGDGANLTADARWSFRAEAAPPGKTPTHAGYTPPGGAGHAPPPAELGYQAPGPTSVTPHAALPGVGAPQKAPRIPNWQIKKWKVIRSKVVVKATEALESPEVQVLQENEIVEQVAPAFTLPNGIIRIQIRHPSSPHFPNPIGWVTQDASAAGGPKFLEPGPQPMDQRFQPRADTRQSWRPPVAAGAPPPMSSWRPPRPGGPPVRAPMAPRGAYGQFQNMTWTPK